MSSQLCSCDLNCKKGGKKLKTERKRRGPMAPNAWSIHVKSFRADNPNLSFKDVLKGASKTYKTSC